MLATSTFTSCKNCVNYKIRPSTIYMAVSLYLPTGTVILNRLPWARLSDTSSSFCSPIAKCLSVWRCTDHVKFLFTALISVFIKTLIESLKSCPLPPPTKNSHNLSLSTQYFTIWVINATEQLKPVKIHNCIIKKIAFNYWSL